MLSRQNPIRAKGDSCFSSRTGSQLSKHKSVSMCRSAHIPCQIQPCLKQQTSLSSSWLSRTSVGQLIRQICHSMVMQGWTASEASMMPHCCAACLAGCRRCESAWSQLCSSHSCHSTASSSTATVMATSCTGSPCSSNSYLPPGITTRQPESKEVWQSATVYRLYRCI